MNICALLSALARLPYHIVVEFKINKEFKKKRIKTDLGGSSGDTKRDMKKYCTNFILKLKNVELCSAKDCSRSWD